MKKFLDPLRMGVLVGSSVTLAENSIPLHSATLIKNADRKVTLTDPEH